MKNNIFIESFGSELSQKTICLNKGDVLFSQNSKIDNIYILKQGRVKLIRNTEEGNSLVIHIAYAGELFAEASLFADKYHCYCVADCSSKLLFFSKNDILKRLQASPEAMINLLKVLTNQVRDLRLLNEIKSIHSANTRVLAYLSHAVNSDNELHFLCSLRDIAQKIGLAHETFYRVLAALEASGKISRTENCLKILKT